MLQEEILEFGFLVFFFFFLPLSNPLRVPSALQPRLINIHTHPATFIHARRKENQICFAFHKFFFGFFFFITDWLRNIRYLGISSCLLVTYWSLLSKFGEPAANFEYLGEHLDTSSCRLLKKVFWLVDSWVFFSDLWGSDRFVRWCWHDNDFFCPSREILAPGIQFTAGFILFSLWVISTGVWGLI